MENFAHIISFSPENVNTIFIYYQNVILHAVCYTWHLFLQSWMQRKSWWIVAIQY